MSAYSVDTADQYASLYQATLAQAAVAGESIIEKVLATARLSLQGRFSLVRGYDEREQLELTLKLLDRNARALSSQYPQALTVAFKQIACHGIVSAQQGC